MIGFHNRDGGTLQAGGATEAVSTIKKRTAVMLIESCFIAYLKKKETIENQLSDAMISSKVSIKEVIRMTQLLVITHFCFNRCLTFIQALIIKNYRLYNIWKDQQNGLLSVTLYLKES